jgi:hypothetical protein
MLIDDLQQLVRTAVPDHLQGLWSPDIETQLLFDDPNPQRAKIRIPKDGRTEPHYEEHAYYPPVSKLRALGTTGWDWQTQRSLFSTIDVDHVAGHVAGHSTETIDDLKRRFVLVDEVEIIRSKGGQGLHLRQYFDPEHLPLARTRDEHIANCLRALTWLSSHIGLDLGNKADTVGVVAWIYHVDRKPGGFELVKQSTAFLPMGWETEFPQHVTTGECDVPDHPAMSVTPQHQALIDWLAQRNAGEFVDGRLNTHTFQLLLAKSDKGLNIKGMFATLASGKDGPTDRNCYAHPDADGSWRVFRHGKNVTEHESWWKSTNGHTTTWFNHSQREEKVNPTTAIVNIGIKDELFHDDRGRTFTTATIRGVKETLQLGDAQNKARLRLAYTAATGKIVSGDALATAIEQLSAIALQEREEYPVSIRVAEYGGNLYIDLANRDRQIVKVTPGEWSVVDDPGPVRFIRPFGLLPLPVPLPGGSLAELRQFVNVDDDDVPLLLAFTVGAFHPTGPYTLLQVNGEQGSAKSSLLRWLHDFIDPSIATGGTLPKDERDLLVAAQLRWLVSYDNVDQLNRKMSSLLCMLATGASSANRKLFTDDSQSILKAKRPVILTAIANVVTASDLLDRTLTLVLPVISPEHRKSEFAISQELRRDGVRGRILGFILDGVAAAIAGHAKVQRGDMPRMADLFSWATAAEPALGLKPGSAIEALKRQSREQSAEVTESQFARAIIKLSKKGWQGTATELAKQVELGQSAQKVGSDLREIAPDLRQQGYVVEFRRSNGEGRITLGVAA